VSDGLDYVIQRILSRYGLSDLPVFANKLKAVSASRWRLAFPFAMEACLMSCGHCKCGRAGNARQNARKVLVIGDGRSDYCVAKQADLVWAKGRLIDHCESHGLPFQPFDSFSEASAWLPGLFFTNSYVA
jgi:2-hydroxy-3-keto-5-methylthiopentenyl-1-phosphate phosphatase